MRSVVDTTRVSELNFLEQVFDKKGPDVIGLYGIPGVGKSTLINQFIHRHPQQCLVINCQQIEPTPKAFLQKLSTLVQSEATLSAICKELKPDTILVLDQFESFNLIETWLRREFMPSVSGHLKIIFSGRIHPDIQWVINPPDNSEFRSLKLNCLSFASAVSYLQTLGHTKIVAMGINQFAHGHPLALQLASSAVLEQSERNLNNIPPNDVVETLVRYFVEDIKDPLLRQALEATSIVRRINESLLARMLNIEGSKAANLYNALSEIEFIEHREDGLSLHDILKNVISANMKSHSPPRYCQYRHGACVLLNEEMKNASPSQLWRYTADIIYLVENPVIRSAFFPPFDQKQYSVVPADKNDKEAVFEIIYKHEPTLLARTYRQWWDKQINTFHCVKNANNQTVGFYCLIKPNEVPSDLIAQDPITSNWMHHLSEDGKNCFPHQCLFIRRWLSLNDGESLNGVQAACWLDIKRAYLEMRPELRRVYLTLNDLQPYSPVATELGFQVLDLDTIVDDKTYYSAMLDMGEGSVDGWISKRLIQEVYQDQTQLHAPEWFDKNAHQLIINANRIDLTPLEFGTLEYLLNDNGSAVTRKELLKQVWGIEYEGSSNVVDTIIKSLRKKLDDKANIIQSVRGVGYRYLDNSK